MKKLATPIHPLSVLRRKRKKKNCGGSMQMAICYDFSQG